MTEQMIYARKRGLVPDWAWYQLNGKSAQENYAEQREQIIQSLIHEDPEINIVSEIKLKK